MTGWLSSGGLPGMVVSLTRPAPIFGIAPTRAWAYGRRGWRSNLWGTPAISVPAGLAGDGLPVGLPVGLHIVGRHHDDATVLRLARLLELARPWPRHAPVGASALCR